jgi:general secretion pathway protein G
MIEDRNKTENGQRKREEKREKDIAMGTQLVDDLGMGRIRHRDLERDGNTQRGFTLSRSPLSVSQGFTLIELLVVMVIIGLLAALVAPRFIRQEEKAKVKAARAQVELLGTALDTLRLDAGRYPTTQEGLEALRRKPGGLEGWDGPYLKKDVPMDPWRKPYIYRSPGQNGPYDLISHGADGSPGGEGDNQDITSWEG